MFPGANSAATAYTPGIHPHELKVGVQTKMYTASFIVALFTYAKGVRPQRPISKQTDKQTVAWPYHATSFGQKEE